MARVHNLLALVLAGIALPALPVCALPGSSSTTAGATLAVAPAGFGLLPQTGADGAKIDPFTTINAAFTPDGKSVYFSKSLPGWTTLTIFVSHRHGSGWSTPVVAPFSGIDRDTDPAITPDGRFVIFSSTRPPRGHEPFSYGLYRAALTGPDAANAVPLADTINAPSTTNLYPSLAHDGTLYFVRPVDKAARIFRAKWINGSYTAPEELQLPGDGPTVSDTDAVIDPAQRFLVFTSNRPDSVGSMDLYLAFKNDAGWCAPIHLPAPVNTIAPEFAPGLSPDGRTLYFASSRSDAHLPREKAIDIRGFLNEALHYEDGTTRLYRVDLSPILDHHRSGCGSSS